MGLFKSGGGGYLNGVTGVIAYAFQPAKEFESKKKGGDPYHRFSVLLSVVPDGGDPKKPLETYLDCGFFHPDEMAISDDGKTLYDVNEAGEMVEGTEGLIREDTDFARFIASAIEKGIPEANFDPAGRSFTAIDGARVTLKKEIDKEATTKFGKRKDKKDPKKEYSRDYLVVSAVLALPTVGNRTTSAGNAVKASPVKRATNGSGKAVAVGDGSSKPKAAAPKAANKPTGPAPSGDVDSARADGVLIDLLAGAPDNTLSRKTISGAIVKYALANNLEREERDALRALIGDEEYLAGAVERGLVTYDSDDRTQPIGLA